VSRTRKRMVITRAEAPAMPTIISLLLGSGSIAGCPPMICRKLLTEDVVISIASLYFCLADRYSLLASSASFRRVSMMAPLEASLTRLPLRSLILVCIAAMLSLPALISTWRSFLFSSRVALVSSVLLTVVPEPRLGWVAASFV